MTATFCSSGIMEKDMSFYMHQPESVDLISLNQPWSQPCHLLLQITNWIILSFPNTFKYLKRKKSPSNQSLPLQIFHTDKKALEQKERH